MKFFWGLVCLFILFPGIILPATAVGVLYGCAKRGFMKGVDIAEHFGVGD